MGEDVFTWGRSVKRIWHTLGLILVGSVFIECLLHLTYVFNKSLDEQTGTT
jgi:hypothetical protein